MTYPRGRTNVSPFLLRAGNLAALTWLRQGFTTRAGGVSTVYGRPDDLNLGLTLEDDPGDVRENRRIALEAVAGDTSGRTWEMVQTRQIHSATILTLTAESPRPIIPGDALVTPVPGSMLAVLAADCVPILLADRRRRVVAAVHAGWRGTVAGIVEATVGTMREQFACEPHDVLAAIGPSIGPCCYQVGEEVQTRFHEAFPYASELIASRHLNLWEANRRQLQDAGVPPANIAVLARCTSCGADERGTTFFSHRAQQGRTGRMMGLIGIVPEPGATPLDPVA